MMIHKQRFKAASGAVNCAVDITVPSGSQFLSAHCQGSAGLLGIMLTEISVWYLFDEGSAGESKRQIQFVETGQTVDVDGTWEYLDTVMMVNDAYVLHVFWREEPNV